MSERNSTFGKRVADARALKGLSLEQMAHKAGVTANTFGNWEAGKSAPRPNKMQMLAGVLGVSISWLLTGDADHDPHEEVHDRLDRLEQKVERMAQLQTELSRLSAEIADEISIIREEKDDVSMLAA